MKKFDVIYDTLSKDSSIIIEEYEWETERHYGLIRFYSHDSGKTYKMLWDNDTIIEFEEVS